MSFVFKGYSSEKVFSYSCCLDQLMLSSKSNTKKQDDSMIIGDSMIRMKGIVKRGRNKFFFLNKSIDNLCHEPNDCSPHSWLSPFRSRESLFSLITSSAYFCHCLLYITRRYSLKITVPKSHYRKNSFQFWIIFAKSLKKSWEGNYS